MREFTIQVSQDTILDIYGIPDDRLYNVEDILFYGKKFLLEYLKSFQDQDEKTIYKNLVISLAWFLALTNRYHLDLEKMTWKRYSYKCPFCGSIPCICRAEEGIKTVKTGRPGSMKPKNLGKWQEMISKIYPNEITGDLNLLLIRRNDNLHYFYRKFLREKEKKYFNEIEKGTSDFFVIFLRVYNSLARDLADDFLWLFQDGCYICHKTPCECNYY